jgi:hypothetical protein
MFGTGRDIMGRYEQNKVSVTSTKVPFYTQNDYLDSFALELDSMLPECQIVKLRLVIHQIKKLLKK